MGAYGVAGASRGNEEKFSVPGGPGGPERLLAIPT